MKRFAGVLLLVLLTGCMTTTSTVLNPSAAHPKLTPSQVTIYTSADKVPGKYEEVAILHTEADDFHNKDAMFNQMRQEAAKLGANGVILGEVKMPGTAARVAGAVFGPLGGITNKKGEAMAIYLPPKGTE